MCLFRFRHGLCKIRTIYTCTRPYKKLDPIELPIKPWNPRSMASCESRPRRPKWRPPLPYLELYMGVLQLLEDLETEMNPTTLEDIQGKNVAIDAYSLLYKAVDVTRCYREIALGLETQKHIDYCMDIAKLLLKHAKSLTFVFHGRTLPVFESFEMDLMSERHENMKRALVDDQSDGEGVEYCMKYYRKAFSISPEEAHQLFKALSTLETERVTSIVAPYDANAQLAFLVKKKTVDVAVTDDPCLILFGCENIIFRMKSDGTGLKFDGFDMLKSFSSETTIAGLNLEQLQTACLLSGCSYSTCQMSTFFVSCSICKKLVTFNEVMESHIPGMKCSYIKDPLKYLEQRIWAFRYQRVYDPDEETLVHLSDPPDTGPKYFKAGNWDFLGPPFPNKEVLAKTVKGELHPITMKPFEVKKNDVPRHLIWGRKMDEYFPTEEEAMDFCAYWSEHCYYSSDDYSTSDKSEDEGVEATKVE